MAWVNGARQLTYFGGIGIAVNSHDLLALKQRNSNQNIVSLKYINILSRIATIIRGGFNEAVGRLNSHHPPVGEPKKKKKRKGL